MAFRTSTDFPDGKDLQKFGGLNYRYGHCYDGIQRSQRSPYALTMESTYRLLCGNPEVYLTCIYRWGQLPAASALFRRSSEIGYRVGRNKFIVPAPEGEECYWKDAQDLIHTFDLALTLDTTTCYILLTHRHPQMILEGGVPAVLLEVPEGSELAVTALLSRVLDLFDVAVFSRVFPQRGTSVGSESPGAMLLSGVPPESSDTWDGPILTALKALAETQLVLPESNPRFLGFSWPIDDRFHQVVERLTADPIQMQRFARIREKLNAGDRTLSNNPAKTALRPMTDELRDVFLCHRSKQKHIVQQLSKALVDVGLTVWLDEAEIRWGDSIIEKLASGITKSRFVIVCVGEDFRTGNFAKYELQLALTQEVSSGHTKVLPLLLTSNYQVTQELLMEVPALQAKAYCTLAETMDAIARRVKEMCRTASA